MQKRFEYDSPVWGTIYAPMLLESGAVVDATFGTRPLFEADLLVRVSDDSINRATTPEEVLRAIDQVIPFIELPDLMVQTPAPPKLNGPGITAINVGARLGVTGTPIPVAQDHGELSNALRDMVTIVKADGAELDGGKGSDVLGNPRAQRGCGARRRAARCRAPRLRRETCWRTACQSVASVRFIPRQARRDDTRCPC